MTKLFDGPSKFMIFDFTLTIIWWNNKKMSENYTQKPKYAKECCMAI